MNKYLRRVKFAAWMLSYSPFVRCVILNGSFASGTIHPDSDIDLLLIGKSGRIFTLRFFAILLMSLFGIKRSNHRSLNHAGKICLNYYLTENYLKIPTGRGTKMDKYCAENYSKSKFLAGNYSLFEKFLRTNIKLFHKHSAILDVPYHEPSGVTNYQPPLNTRMLERVLSGKFGNRVESKLKSMQIGRIEVDPITKKYPNLIVYNDRELRFHPPKIVKSP